jgi:hypothetical protein
LRVRPLRAFFKERSETSNVSVGGCKFYLRTEVDREAVVALRVIERFEQRGNNAAPVLFQMARMERQSRGGTLGAWKFRAEDLWPTQMVPDGGAASCREFAGPSFCWWLRAWRGTSCFRSAKGYFVVDCEIDSGKPDNFFSTSYPRKYFYEYSTAGDCALLSRGTIPVPQKDALCGPSHKTGTSPFPSACANCPPQINR